MFEFNIIKRNYRKIISNTCIITIVGGFWYLLEEYLYLNPVIHVQFSILTSKIISGCLIAIFK